MFLIESSWCIEDIPDSNDDVHNWFSIYQLISLTKYIQFIIKHSCQSPKLRKKYLDTYQETFLILEDVPDCWGGDQQPQVIIIWCPQPYLHSSVSQKHEKIYLDIYKEPFLTLEDVPDSWDGDQQPQVVPIWCPK